MSQIERGHLERVTVASLRAVAAVLEIRLDIVARWHGGDLDRLLNSAHSAMHEAMAAIFEELDGWLIVPEVSFAIYGERGVIDLLAWHAASATLLLIELKTDVVDVQETLGTFDRKRRLAAKIAAERGWTPRTIGCWLAIAESTTNRRRVAAHARTLRAALPEDGPAIRAWLRRPGGPIAALSFLSYASRDSTTRVLGPRKRVRRRAPARLAGV